MTTLDTTIDQITARFDLDPDAAEWSARLYLHQVQGLDGQDYGEDALPDEIADFIIKSIAVQQETTPPTLLDDVTTAAQRMKDAHQQRDTAIRTALAAGLPLKQVAEAACMSRQAIYNIRDRRATA